MKSFSPHFFLLLLGVLFLANGCNGENQKNDQQTSEAETRKKQNQEAASSRSTLTASIILQFIPGQHKFIQELPLPAGYERINAKAKSFGEYLQKFPLKQKNNTVYLYNGQPKANQNVHFAILDLDVGTKDLQQCADAIMRLRAEYLFHQKRTSEISFHFTNGVKASYLDYAQGKRAVIHGNTVKFLSQAAPDHSYQNFKKYLELIFNYAGSASLSKELKSIAYDDIHIGDVFIQGGFPGHAIIVVDMAKKQQTGKKIFLLAQSYMPAQEIHILKNPDNIQLSPWYSEDFGSELFTPEWIFKKSDRKRFEDDE